MSETRVSSSQPQAPAFQTPEAPSKAPEASQTSKAPLSASKASKATPARPQREHVAAHLTKGGKVGQCQVLTAKGQCSNPSRHALLGGFTCTTHGKRINLGKVYRMAKRDIPYDPSLWGGPQPASKATKAS